MTRTYGRRCFSGAPWRRLGFGRGLEHDQTAHREDLIAECVQLSDQLRRARARVDLRLDQAKQLLGADAPRMIGQELPDSAHDALPWAKQGRGSVKRKSNPCGPGKVTCGGGQLTCLLDCLTSCPYYPGH